MKKLAITRSGYGSYFVINHNWDESNGRIEIYRSIMDPTIWRDTYTGAYHVRLSEAKASVFAALQTDGLGIQ